MKPPSRNLLVIAFVSGALAVSIGAFGAHGLKPHLDAYQLSIFEKGVQYHFIHTIALLFTAYLYSHHQANGFLKWATYLFAIGIWLFSGSLYLLACRDLLPFSVLWAGPITPLGGLSFILAWILGALGVRQ